MPEATTRAPSPSTTIVPGEAAHFGALAAEWWDPAGASAMLHRLNPVRLGHIRRQADRHFGSDSRDRRPLAGRRVLDMGCGGGLLAEPLARLGATVTAVDAAPENVAVARAHATNAGLDIDYRVGDTAAVAGERFDLVVSLEVIEHVADPARFVAQLGSALAPGGLLIMSTPNRTALSRVAMIAIGEGLRLIPRGTHDWGKFLKPAELTALLNDAGLSVVDTAGFAYDPLRGARMSDSLDLDYFLTATHAAPD